MTASAVSASMVMLAVPLIQVRSATAPAWKGPPGGTSVMSHAPGADRLLIRPAGEPGRCRQPGRQVKSKARPKAARSLKSQPGPPAPILAAAQAEPPGNPHRSLTGARCRRLGLVLAASRISAGLSSPAALDFAAIDEVPAPSAG